MRKLLDKYFLYIPLILVELYLTCTVLLYQFGPLDWKTENQGLFWFFLIAYHLAFIGGYLFSVKKIRLRKPEWTLSALSPKKYQAVMWGIIIISVICACIEYKNTTHASSYIPYELPKNFINGLINPADQYYNKFVSEDYVSNKLVTLLSSLFSFIYVSLISLLVVEWKRINLPQKICFFGIILFKVAIYVSIGTNKGIFDTMFYFVGILLILGLLNLIHKTDRFIDKKTFIQVAAFALFLVVFSFCYFTVNISSRVKNPVDYAISDTEKNPEATEPESEAETEPTTDAETDAPIATDPPVAAPDPEETPDDAPQAEEKPGFIKRMYYSVTNYLTQGYYGMSLSLDEEFTTTYGIGNSQFLRSNFKSIFGIDVKDRTYQHKITDQWHEDQKWHSFYSYIANDVSFYGVILVMLLLGIFFGLICKDVMLNDSLIGKLLLMLFVILFMYMPANNQVFTSMATFMAFFELSFLWLLSKIKWKKGLKNGK